MNTWLEKNRIDLSSTVNYYVLFSFYCRNYLRALEIESNITNRSIVDWSYSHECVSITHPALHVFNFFLPNSLVAGKSRD